MNSRKNSPKDKKKCHAVEWSAAVHEGLEVLDSIMEILAKFGGNRFVGAEIEEHGRETVRMDVEGRTIVQRIEANVTCLKLDQSLEK